MRRDALQGRALSASTQPAMQLVWSTHDVSALDGTTPEIPTSGLERLLGNGPAATDQ